MHKTALIVGAGAGISASFARGLAKDGFEIALSARTTTDLASLAAATGASVHACDAADPASVDALFKAVDAKWPRLGVVLYNASFRTRGPFESLDKEDVRKALLVSAYGGFLVGQAAVKRMLPHKDGAILFTGASASVKGYAQSAPFAMGKFALRGLAQSMARELQPKGIHVAHFVIDGAVRNAGQGRVEGAGDVPDSLLDPDAIAEAYLHVLKQPRSAWTSEVELRPWVERF